MSALRSYSSPFAVGHKAAALLFDGPVVVEEKIDGSQFSFGIKDGVLHARSRGATLNIDEPEGMFAAGVAAVRERAHLLTPGYTYRGEYLQKPKHNSLAYERVPVGHVVLYDVDKGDQHYLTPAEKQAEAARLGFDCVPILYEGTITSMEQFKALLPANSILGPVQPEGIVAKNYARFCPDKKVLMGKYVTDAFKEKHAHEWKQSNPSTGDVITTLILELRTDARWEKAIQHLREAGTLTDTPRDIGALLKEVASDVHKDEADYIKDKLFKHAWPHISRGVIAGLPEWYKERVLVNAFPVEQAA